MLQINSLVFNFSTSATEKNEKTVVLWDGKFHLILSKLTLINIKLVSLNNSLTSISFLTVRLLLRMHKYCLVLFLFFNISESLYHSMYHCQAMITHSKALFIILPFCFVGLWWLKIFASTKVCSDDPERKSQPVSYKHKINLFFALA